MAIHDGQPWPINRAERKRYHHMDTGVVVEGIVQHLRRDGVDYYAIRDGGYWHHPDLRPWVGQPMVIWLDTEKDQLELRSYMPQLAFIRVLAELPQDN